MNMPGIPAQPLPEGDDATVAERLLSLIDANPDRTAIVIVDEAPDDELDEHEARMIRVFDIAKGHRPDLAVMLLPAVYRGENASSVTALAVVIHEHRWVGGMCVNGCRDTREADAA